MPIVLVILLAASIFYSTAFGDNGKKAGPSFCLTRLEHVVSYLTTMGAPARIGVAFNEQKNFIPANFRFFMERGQLVAQLASNGNFILRAQKNDKFRTVIRPANMDFGLYLEYYVLSLS